MRLNPETSRARARVSDTKLAREDRRAMARASSPLTSAHCFDAKLLLDGRVGGRGPRKGVRADGRRATGACFNWTREEGLVLFGV